MELAAREHKEIHRRDRGHRGRARSSVEHRHLAEETPTTQARYLHPGHGDRCLARHDHEALATRSTFPAHDAARLDVPFDGCLVDATQLTSPTTRKHSNIGQQMADSSIVQHARPPATGSD